MTYEEPWTETLEWVFILNLIYWHFQAYLWATNNMYKILWALAPTLHQKYLEDLMQGSMLVAGARSCEWGADPTAQQPTARERAQRVSESVRMGTREWAMGPQGRDARGRMVQRVGEQNVKKQREHSGSQNNNTSTWSEIFVDMSWSYLQNSRVVNWHSRCLSNTSPLSLPTVTTLDQDIDIFASVSNWRPWLFLLRYTRAIYL